MGWGIFFFFVLFKIHIHNVTYQFFWIFVLGISILSPHTPMWRLFSALFINCHLCCLFYFCLILVHFEIFYLNVFEEWLIKFDSNKVYGNCHSLLDCTSKLPTAFQIWCKDSISLSDFSDVKWCRWVFVFCTFMLHIF